MTQFVVLAALCAVADWFAVLRERQRIEQFAKPGVMVFLFAFVATSGPNLASAIVAIGLAFSLLGDVALLPKINRFRLGLLAFLVGHVFFVAGFVIGGRPIVWVGVALGALLSAVVVQLVGRSIIAGARRTDVELAHPVAIYVTVLATMLSASFLPGSLLAAAGGTLFAGSDAVLGWNRFVQTLPRGRLLTHVPYHLGQILIAVWAVQL